MSNAYFDLLLSWIGHADIENSPHRDAVYAEAVTVGLEGLRDDTVASQLAQFIGMGKIPARFHQTLRTCDHPDIRIFAWRTYHSTATIDDWVTAITAETDPRVLEEMVRYSPATRLSEELKWKMLGAPDERLTASQAELLIRLPFRAGWENQWREAVYALPPENLWGDSVRRLMEPVVTGEVRDLDPDRAAPLYLLAEALAFAAEPGAVVDLLATRPDILTQVSPNTEVDAWIGTLAKTAVNRRDDLLAINAAIEAAPGHFKPKLRDELAFWVPRVQTSSPEEFTVRLARLLTQGATPAGGERPVPFHLAACWHRLTNEQRTDKVCQEILKAVGHQDTTLAVALSAEVVAHLGDKAHPVASIAGLLELKKHLRYLPAWWRQISQDQWVRGFALVNGHTDAETMAKLPQEDVDALVAHLHAEPLEWAPAAIESLLQRTDIGPDVWERLSIDQLMALMTIPGAANWLAGVVTEERMGAPLVRETLMAGSTREMPFGGLVTATHAIA